MSWTEPLPSRRWGFLVCQGFSCGPSAILSASVGGGIGWEYLRGRVELCDVLDVLDLSESALGLDPAE